MLLVAVTGPVGSGKSTTLIHLAEGSAELSVDGFIAVAGDRDDPARGASRYDLLLLNSGTLLPFLTRGERGYEIDKGADQNLGAWSDQVKSGLDLLILDEFGNWEAEGNGHWPLYQTLTGKRPKMVVIGVRESALEEIQHRLGRPFDVIVTATDPKSVDTLLGIANQRPDWERVGLFGAGCGVVEVSVGTALHALYFPGTGMAMSSTQAATLTLGASGLSVKARSSWIGIITAGLKAFSPAGSRLGPMLAISMQGLLYNWAIATAGWNAVGIGIGGALMGIWAASQGFLIQYLMLGKSIEKAYEEISRWIGRIFNLPAPSLGGLMVGVVTVYGFASGLAAWQTFRIGSKHEGFLESRITRHKDRLKNLRTLKHSSILKAGALLLPTAIVLLILKSMGTQSPDLIVLAIRSLSVVLLLNAIVKRWNPLGLVEALRKRGIWGPSYAFRTAIVSEESDLKDGS